MKNKILDQLGQCEEKDPNKFWNMIQKLKNAKDKSNPLPIEEWAKYFNSLHNEPMVSKADDNFLAQIESKLAALASNQASTDSLDKDFTLSEVTQGIKKLKSRKSAGPDFVLNEMLKSGSDVLAKVVLKLCNLILESEQLPSKWATGYIVPIFKSGCESDKTNYRGISITSCIGKLFCSLINNRIVNFLDTNNILA